MAKAKDFYGKDIASVIEQACRDFAASQEDLDIEVMETGSAGIFGLCKKKAHIRARMKTGKAAGSPAPVAEPSSRQKADAAEDAAPAVIAAVKQVEEDVKPVERESVPAAPPPEAAPALVEAEDANGGEEMEFEEDAALEPPSEENLEAIRADLEQLLAMMRFPSTVEAVFDRNTVQCTIRGEYEESLVGHEGRTLDSIQYLLRKMVARHLPDKVVLSLNAGDFRERRASELKILAVELAEQVKADGKTQAIPALNPSERRVVHVVLQEDKGVRSRSVGDGLFKKVLIYKPGKGRRPASRKRKSGGQGGRSSDD